MKKHPNIILLLALIAAVIFFAVSCKDEPAAGSGDSGSGDPAPQGVTMPVSKETGKQRLLALGADDPGRSEFLMGNNYNGFKIRATLNDGTGSYTVEIGGSDAIYWFAQDKDYSGSLDLNEYSFFLGRDNKGYEYMYSSWASLVAAKGTLTSNIFNPLVDVILFSAYGTEVQENMTFVEKDTLNERDCSVYSTTVDSQTVKFWVDDYFGITLKIEYAGAASGSYTVNARIYGTLFTGSGYPSYTPSEYPDSYEGIYNQTCTYIKSGRPMSDLAGTWDVPAAITGGTLTLNADGTGTLTENDNNHAVTVTFVTDVIDLLTEEGMAVRLSIPSCHNMVIQGLLAMPEDKSQFILKNAWYESDLYDDDDCSLTFLKKP